jgi:glutathione synthase/RimK-type ligase-like ATP-grasp enzyme
VVDSREYLYQDGYHQKPGLRVINLCQDYHYQTIGYYISLLASARSQKALPSIDNLHDIFDTNFTKSITTDIDTEIQHSLQPIKGDSFPLSIYFGHNLAKCHDKLAKCLHGLFPFPLLRVHFEKKKTWGIRQIQVLSLQDIPASHQEFLQKMALQYLSKKRFPQGQNKKKRYHHLAILVDPYETNAPSNPKALECFVHMGETMGFHVDTIEKKNNKSLTDYDALFIRATTSVNHYTYRFARKALQENMVVIDDPQSIMRCTNKVYLAELLRSHQILTPETLFLNKYDKKLPKITFPCVLKKPDGAFSQGVVKMEDESDLQKSLKEFFKGSELVLLQPFIPTAFDWRIGILDNKPLFACRYFMAHNHWQIINWNAQKDHKEGGHETVPLHKVPENVMKTALKSTKLIGNGLYGVDIKTYHNKAYVIEINDNPNIDFGIEDEIAGEALYKQILQLFLERITRKPYHA